MEVLVTNSFGLPDDAVVSVRFGTTRRQAPLETVTTNPLKFPSTLESVAEPLKIDILAPIATTRLVLFPHAEQYQIGFEQNDDLEIGLNIKPTGADKQDASRPASAGPVKFQDAAASAKDYLEGHGLLRYVQSMLHAVIQVKPKDPYAFMIEQLSAAQSKSKTIRSRPSSAIPGGRTLSRPGSAMHSSGGLVPVPPSSPPPSATGERTRPPFGSQGHWPSDDEKVQPMPPREERPKTDQVPEPAVQPPPLPPPSEEGHSFSDQPPAGPQPVADAPPQAATVVETATKPAASQDADVENLKLRMRGLLESAYTAGTLTEAVQSTLASGRGPHKEAKLDDNLDDLKVKMRTLLENAATSGQLEEAIQKSLQQKRDGEVQVQPASITAQAEPPAKGSAPPSQAAAQADTELLETKEKLRRLLTTSTDNGELEESLQRMASQKNAEELQSLKGKLLGIFEKATASGDLAQALQAVCPKSGSTADQELEDVKAKLRTLMQDATESGKLAEALQNTLKKQTPKPAAGDDTEETIRALRALLEESTKSGELEQALQGVRVKQDIDKLQDLKSQVGGVLFEAVDSGKLGELLKASPREPKKCKTQEEQKIEQEVGKTEDKQETPRVEENEKKNEQTSQDKVEVNHGRSASQGEAKAGGDLNVDQIKTKLQGLLQDATESGTIKEKAEGAFSPKKADAAPPLDKLVTPPPEDDIDQLKGRLRGVLSEACLSGKLSKVLGTVTAPAEEAEVAKKPAPAEAPAAEAASKSVSAEAAQKPATVESPTAEKPVVGDSAAKSSSVMAEETSAEGEPDEAELQAIKVKLRSLMQAASESGKLVEALATISQKQNAAESGRSGAPSAAELDEIKSKLRNLMQEAQESGKLSKTLATMAATSQQPPASVPDNDLEAVKVKLRGLMQEAAESGKLAEAVRNVVGEKDSEASTVQTPPKEEELHAIKDKLRGLMTEANQSGKLREALENLGKGQGGIQPAKVPAESDELAEVKAKLRSLMTDGLQSGSLVKALEGIGKSREDTSPPDVDKLQEELSSMKAESQSLHSTVDKLAAEMEALKRTNEELARRLAEHGKAPS